MSQSVTLSVNLQTLEKMREFYLDDMIPNDGEYVDFFAKVNGVVITAFLSKKETKKVTFLGDNALQEAKIWDINAVENTKKEFVKEQWLFQGDQIGSDEVGVGDFLLPMIVVAAYVRKSDMKDLKFYGITDSKKLSDVEIKQMGPQLVKRFFYSKLTLSNDKYNQMIEKGENLNSLKAKMHNRALLNMLRKYPEVRNIYIDQFVQESTYYKYLNDKNEQQVKRITFKTKGESFYPCVALASVIARYAFILEREKLNKQYNVTIPFGASRKCDDFAYNFAKNHSLEELKKLAKTNFVNYKNLENKLNQEKKWCL